MPGLSHFIPTSIVLFVLFILCVQFVISFSKTREIAADRRIKKFVIKFKLKMLGKQWVENFITPRNNPDRTGIAKCRQKHAWILFYLIIEGFMNSYYTLFCVTHGVKPAETNPIVYDYYNFFNPSRPQDRQWNHRNRRRNAGYSIWRKSAVGIK